MAFRTEAELLEVALCSPNIWDIVDAERHSAYVEVEPAGLFGIPDLVIANIERCRLGASDGKRMVGRTVAFEMKLANWKRALSQAFRYRTFANKAYVMMDSERVRPATTHLDAFRRSNVGLLSISGDGKIDVHFEPEHDDPMSEHLGSRLEAKILARIGGEQCAEQRCHCRIDPKDHS